MIRFSDDEKETILSAALLGIASPSATYFQHFYTKERSQQLEDIMLKPNSEETTLLIKELKSKK